MVEHGLAGERQAEAQAVLFALGDFRRDARTDLPARITAAAAILLAVRLQDRGRAGIVWGIGPGPCVDPAVSSDPRRRITSARHEAHRLYDGWAGASVRHGRRSKRAGFLWKALT